MVTPEVFSETGTEAVDLQNTLDTHPDVDRSAVIGDTAYVVPRRTSSVDLDYDTLNREYVEEWQAVYDYVYSSGGSQDATFDVRGWTSSYTGAEISPEDMREWVDQTVSRIKGLGSRRILELGCGTGLLLHRLMDGVDSYYASDVSAGAVERIRGSFGGQIPDKIRLRHAPADDLGFVSLGEVDTVVINSVAQYFLDENYLTHVLAQAIDTVAHNGIVYVGDVRSAALNRTFSAGLELELADDDLSREQVQSLVERRCCTGTELLIDPGYFRDLHKALPRVAHVSILPKRGRRWTEMNRFRFDAVLRLDTPPRPVTVPEWQDWAGLDVDTLTRSLLEQEPAVLGFRNVPNARSIRDHSASLLLAAPDGHATAGSIRAAAEKAGPGVHPEDLWAIGDHLPYHVHLDWGRSAPDGAFDLALVRTGQSGSVVDFPSTSTAPRQHTNRIWHALVENVDTGLLRDHLRSHLPHHTLPARFVVLEELPRTPGGDVDQAALAAIQWA